MSSTTRPGVAHTDTDAGQERGPQPPGGFTRQPSPKRADRPRDHRQADDEAPLDSLSSSVPVVPLLYAATSNRLASLR